MKKYSYLYGTTKEGVYSQIACSAELGNFITELGGTNAERVLQLVQAVVNDGFSKLPGAEEQPVFAPPYAVRYAPMHLYKRNDMSRVGMFAALGVDGGENSARASVFHQTEFFAHEIMQNSVEENGIRYNYLDQLFGTHRLDWREVANIRKGLTEYDCDSLPKKTNPELDPLDVTLVTQICKSVYEQKAVLVRLEPNVLFNQRADELLMQVYSLLPPYLATETGFAVYVNPADIQKLLETTSIRIFVLPAGCSYDQVDQSTLTIFDLADAEQKIPQEKNDVTKVISRWMGLDWSVRQPIMESLFSKENYENAGTNYKDKDFFVNRSIAFFTDPFFRWSRSTEEDCTLTTLEELWQVYIRYPVCEEIAWAKEQFAQKAVRLLKPNKLDVLTVKLLADILYGSLPEDQLQEKKALYFFASSLGKIDPIRAGIVAGKKALEEAEPLHKAEIAKKDAQLASQAEEFRVKLVQEQQRTAAAEETGRRNTEAAVLEGQKNVERTREEGRQALIAEQMVTLAVRQQAAADLAEEQKRTAKAIEDGNNRAAAEQQKTAAAVADGDNRVAAEQRNTEAVRQQGLLALAEEKKKTAAAISDGNTRVEAVRQEMAQAVAAEQEKTTKVEKDLQTARITTESIRAELTGAVEAEKRKGNELQSSIQEKNDQIKDLQTRLEKARAGLSADKLKMLDEYPKLKKKSDSLHRDYQELYNRHMEDKDAIADLEDQLKVASKKAIISGVAGLLVAVLICGGSWYAFGRSEKPDDSNEPVVTETVEPSEETKAETVPETVEETTESARSEKPEVLNLTQEITKQWLMDQYPEIAAIEAADALPVWVKGAPEAIVTLTSGETAIFCEASEVTEQTEASQENQETTEPQNATESGIQLMIQSGRQLVILEQDTAQKDVFRKILTELTDGAEAVEHCYVNGEKLDLDFEMMGLDRENWWNEVEDLTADPSKLNLLQMELETTVAPMLSFTFENQRMVIFREAIPYMVKELDAGSKQTMPMGEEYTVMIISVNG